MKKTVFGLICILLLISSAIFGQVSKLDEKNGFKTIKFGTNIYDFKVTYAFKDDSGIRWFTLKPSDSDLLYVFDNKMDEIILGFDSSDKLVSLRVMKSFEGHNHYQSALALNEKIIKKFQIALGPPGGLIDDDQSGTLGAYWSGQKVGMTVSTLYFGFDKNSITMVSYLLIDNALQNIDDGF